MKYHVWGLASSGTAYFMVRKRFNSISAARKWALRRWGKLGWQGQKPFHVHRCDGCRYCRDETPKIRKGTTAHNIEGISRAGSQLHTHTQVCIDISERSV